MTRNLIIVVSAIILSYVLICFAGWVIASSENMQFYLDVYADHSKGNLINDKRAEEFFSRFEQDYFLISWLYNPVIVLLIGSFTGLFSKKYVWQIGVH